MDVHLKIDGVDGESQEKGFEKQIQVLSYSWGASQFGTAGHGGGEGASKVNMQDFSFTMTMCIASPKLLLFCASGEHIKEAILTLRKPTGSGGLQQPFLIYTFKDLIISSYQSGGSESPGLPVESISFNFSEVKQKYFVQDEKGGLKPGPETGWNVKKNTKA